MAALAAVHMGNVLEVLGRSLFQGVVLVADFGVEWERKEGEDADIDK